MKKLIAILLSSMLLTSCSKDKITGSGPVQTEQRNISGFKKLEISGNTKVFITQGAAFKVEVKAYSNLLPYFDTKTEGEILRSGYTNGTNISNDNAQLYVTMPLLNGIAVNGNAVVSTTGDFSGSGNFDLRITGNGSINLQKGSAANATFDLVGNGTVNAFGFVATNAFMNLTGQGIIEISTVDKLNVTIKGNGIVYYKGDPVVTSAITGNGRIEKR